MILLTSGGYKKSLHFLFLMNMKGGVLYFSYVEEAWLSEIREEKPLPIRISSPVRSGCNCK